MCFAVTNEVTNISFFFIVYLPHTYTSNEKISLPPYFNVKVDEQLCNKMEAIKSCGVERMK